MKMRKKTSRPWKVFAAQKTERAMLILKTKRRGGGKLEMERTVMCQRVLKDILRSLGFI